MNIVNRYYNDAYEVPAGSVVVPQLGSFIKDAAKAFQQQNNNFPVAVVVYRGTVFFIFLLCNLSFPAGIGASQMNTVVNNTLVLNKVLIPK